MDMQYDGSTFRTNSRELVENRNVFSMLGLLLEEKFFYNKNVYAKQLKSDDGKVIYNTIYNKIDANIVRYMIQNKQSIMTYQQNADKLKWLCLDFDIKSAFLDESYEFLSDEKYKPMLLKDVSNTISTLKELDIKFTLEYSGNRGIHIWIFLDREINKQLGDAILRELMKKVKFDYIDNEYSPITVDKYPKNGKPRDNKIGLGVKIPLSYHLKSNAYSYIINDISEIKKIEYLESNILDDQKEKLLDIATVPVDYLLTILDVKTVNEIREFDKVIGTLKEEIELEKVIKMLSKCKVYDYIFSKEISKLTELDRAILTGTLIRLRSNENPNYGRDLLISYFSSDVNVYNSEITKEKLNLMRSFYPPSLEYIQNKYRIECNYCKKNSIKNVLELLDGLTVVEEENTNDLLNWVIEAEYRYLLQNDEVPLNYLKDQLSSLKNTDLNKEVLEIKSGNYQDPKFFKYVRKEENKERILYSLGASERVLTTYIMYEINKVLYGEYASSCSYSYRLNYNFYQRDIFVSWNSLWLQYVKDIEDKILNDAYDDYYILKLDIKSFYDNINQIFLREILSNKPTKLIEIVLNNLDEKNKKTYKNMCEYLLYVSKSTSEKGVPQGPAYARYLAEIYLSSLDRLILDHIDNNFEHYFRYVDDMVIILKGKEEAHALLNIINSHLNLYDLNLNDKYLEGYVLR